MWELKDFHEQIKEGELDDVLQNLVRQIGCCARGLLSKANGRVIVAYPETGAVFWLTPDAIARAMQDLQMLRDIAERTVKSMTREGESN